MFFAAKNSKGEISSWNTEGNLFQEKKGKEGKNSVHQIWVVFSISFTSKGRQTGEWNVQLDLLASFQHEIMRLLQ